MIAKAAWKNFGRFYRPIACYSRIRVIARRMMRADVSRLEPLAAADSSEQIQLAKEGKK